MTTHSIATIRREKGQTLDDFGDAVGITSKSHASMIERGSRQAPVEIALAIESWSDGRIPARTLNDNIALIERARGLDGVHAGVDTDTAPSPSSGKNTQIAGGALA